MIQKVFGRLGYRICKIRRGCVPDIEDPLLRNDKCNAEKLWGSKDFRKTYLSERRTEFYREVFKDTFGRGFFSERDSVIDVGCGPGFFLNSLREQGFNGDLSGCDFSEEAIKSAKSSCPDIDFFVQDVYHPIKRSGDVIFCMQTLEHLFHPGLALQNLSKAASRLIITVPEGRRDSFHGHINFWSKESFEIFLSDHLSGWTIAVAEINNGNNLLALLDRNKRS